MSTSAFDPSLLLGSQPFQKLLAQEQEIGPFEVLGIQSDERAHSRVLGGLLSAAVPFGLSPMPMPRLASHLRAACSDAVPRASTLIKLSAARFRVRLEHPCNLSSDGPSQELGRMDLLLEDESQKLAVVSELLPLPDRDVEPDGQLLMDLTDSVKGTAACRVPAGSWPRQDAPTGSTATSPRAAHQHAPAREAAQGLRPWTGTHHQSPNGSGKPGSRSTRRQEPEPGAQME